MHEGIPIHNYLVPKEFTPRERQAHRRRVREGQGRIRCQGPPQAGVRRRARPAFPMRRCAGRGRSGERCSPGSSATSASSSIKWGMPKVDTQDHGLNASRRCSSAATRPSARRTSSGPSRTATRPRVSIDKVAQWRGHHRPPCTRGRGRSARRWASTSGPTTTTSRSISATACRRATKSIALKDIAGRSRARLRRQARFRGRRSAA